MGLDLEKLDLIHRLSRVMGPKQFNQEFIRNCLIVLTLLSDQDTRTGLMKLIQRMETDD